MNYTDWVSRGMVNLDTSNKCTLECPKCARTRFTSKKSIPGHIMTDKEFHSYLKHFDGFVFSGQVSDPILHPDLPNMLKQIKAAGKTASIHTSASHRPEKFYRECFSALPSSTWIFGIDGLPESSHNYRINQDGKKLFEMMLLSKEYVQQTIWQFIIFKYNQNQIEAAKDLSRQHGIPLRFVQSSRWDGDEDELKPSSDEFYIEKDDGYVA